MTAEENGPQATSAALLKTLLVSDLVGSTKMVEKLGDERAFQLFGRHDRVARDLLAKYNGREIDKTDGFLLLFDRPIDAVGYALAYHRALEKLSEVSGVEVSSRVGIHLGEVYLRENPAEDVARGAKPLEVEGLAKPMAARLMSVALGRQTLLTRSAFDVARRAAVGESFDEGELQWQAHGAYMFKGVDEPVNVFEVGVAEMSPLAPPPDSEKVTRVIGDVTILGWRPGPGLEVPHRPNWQLQRKLGEGGFGEVWLAQHKKTHDARVFKFCFDGERLRGLQREVTLFRLLKETLGSRRDIARILDWNFDEPPYFVESEYTEGGSLLDWSSAGGGAQQVALADRIELMAQVSEALAAAHSVGVLHKDLKPANVLVNVAHDGTLQARLTDFGIGLVTDQQRLAEAGITAMGFSRTVLEEGEAYTTGTQLYMAPEQLEGRPATVQADIYALGVMLYQLVLGDLRRALAPGWERDVPDELLREDIAALVDSSPERRLADAGEAARRLRTLEQRRAEREAELRAREEAEQNRLVLEQMQRRRKIGAAVLAFLTLFAIAMAVQSLRIAREAERAENEAGRAAKAAAKAELEAEKANQVSQFVIDLFEESNPEVALGEDLTASELLQRGAERIEESLGDQPVVKARLTQALGNIYFKRGEFDKVESLYRETLALREEHLEANDPEVLLALRDLATLYAETGRLEQAGPLFERALAVAEEILDPDDPELANLLTNCATLALLQGKPELALERNGRALAIKEQLFGKDSIKLALQLANQGRMLSTLGRFEQAEQALQRSIALYEQDESPDHPVVAQALTILSSTYREMGRLDEAETAIRRALAIYRKVLGESHPLVAVGLSNLGLVLTDQGRLGDAGTALVQAREIAVAAFDEQHPLTGEIMGNTAYLRQHQGRPAEAEQLARDAISIIERQQGEDNPDLLVSLRVAADVCLADGRADEGRALLERASRIAASAYGADHPTVAALAGRLASIAK